MKKFAAIALALVLAMSSMFATVGVAGSSEEAAYDNNELSIGFEIKDNGKGVVVDVENMKIYGLEPLLTVEALETNYLSAGTGFTMKVVDAAGEPVKYVGTGTQIVLNDGNDDYSFDVVIFGDITGDSVIDVVDAAQAQRISAGKVEATELATFAGDSDKDGEITVEDYATQVNAAISEKPLNQNATGTEKTGIVEVDEQVYVSGNEKDYALTDKDVTLTYNDIEVDSRYFDISGVKYTKVEGTSEIYGEVTITGKGLFRGEITLKIEVVSLLEKVVATVNEVIEEANLANVCTAKYEVVNGVADIKVEVNASDIIRGNFDVEMAGLNGLLTKIDEFKAENLQEATLTVGDLAIATNGDFDRSAIKALVFDIAKGIFCDIANADDNVVKSYSGVLVTNNKIADLAEEFNIDVVMTGTGKDIDRVKAFAAKVSRYVAFDVVDGNAVIDVTMPAGFATKVVDVLSKGTGDVDVAIAEFNKMDIATAMVGYLARVDASDISAGSVEEIEQAMKVALMLVDLANKGLGEIADATVTSNVKTMPLLSGRDLYVDETESNKFGAIVKAFAVMLSDEVLYSNVGDFYNDGIYTVAADVELDYRNIKETIIVNFDLFGAVETPTIIEETATYFSDIIKTLGIANVATVSYDEDAFRALVTMNATELLNGNLQFNDKALDGLYTNIKGYFDDNYGTATIVVDGYEIVTAGAIKKSALKAYLFDFVNGFFADAAAMNGANIIRSSAVKVTEADGTAHNFDLDFQLVGNAADVAKVKSISGKVANYVSLDTTSGNAIISIGLPEAMRAKVIAKLGGDAEAAQAMFNEATVAEALMGYLAKVDPSDISASNADEIQTVINMVAGMDTLVNKLLGKVASASAYDVNGNALPLLSDRGFNVTEATVEGLVQAVAVALNDDVLNNGIVNYMNADGTYTVKCDVALTVGGIKETVIVNLDIFGDYEKKTAVEKTAEYVSDIFFDLGISNIASVTYEDGKAVAALDATAVINNGISFDEKALDGLYTDIKGYFDETFSDSTIKVGDYEIVTAGKINKTAVKNLVFAAATGFFQDAANLDVNNVLRSFNTVVIDGEGNAEEFVLDFALAGNDTDIAKVADLANTVSKYVSLDTTSGNATVTVGLPEGMRAKVIEKLGGDAEKAQATFNEASVAEALMGYLAKVDATDISANYASKIQKAIDMVAGMEAIADKLLGKVASAKVYDVNGNALTLLSDRGFNINEKSFAGLVEAVAVALNDDVLNNGIVNYMNADGTYTVKCDVALTVGGIKETVILNLDIFGDYEKKTAIDNTVDYAEDIIEDLGLAGVASVTYADGKAVAALDAGEILAGNLAFNDGAIDGLYSDIRDYFDANYGDSTITVGGFEIVKDGNINKPVLKQLIFDFATGFFSDVANMDANVINSYATKVVDGDGNVEEFAFDFALAGEPEEIEKMQTIAGKVANCVSLDTTSGNAAVKVDLPAGMKDKIISHLGGSEEAARAKINEADVATVLVGYIGNMDASDVSASSADEIQTAINMVAGMDAVINKVISKASTSVTYVNGKPVVLFSNRGFNVEDATFEGVAKAAAVALSDEILGTNMANFENEDGTYTITCDVTVKGITEKLTFTFDLF